MALPGARDRSPLTMYFGPHTMLLTMEVAFAATLPAGEWTSVIARLERRVCTRHPDIAHVLVEARWCRGQDPQTDDAARGGVSVAAGLQ